MTEMREKLFKNLFIHVFFLINFKIIKNCLFKFEIGNGFPIFLLKVANTFLSMLPSSFLLPFIQFFIKFLESIGTKEARQRQLTK